MFPNDDTRPPMSPDGKTLFAVGRRMNGPAEPSRMVLIELAITELASALAAYRSAAAGRIAPMLKHLPPADLDRLMLKALQAKDLLDPDVIEQDRIGALADLNQWLLTISRPVGHDECARKVLECYIARQITPRPLPQATTEWPVRLEKCHSCGGDVELHKDDSITCSTCGSSYGHIAAVRAKAAKVWR